METASIRTRAVIATALSGAELIVPLLAASTQRGLKKEGQRLTLVQARAPTKVVGYLDDSLLGYRLVHKNHDCPSTAFKVPESTPAQEFTLSDELTACLFCFNYETRSSSEAPDLIHDSQL